MKNILKTTIGTTLVTAFSMGSVCAYPVIFNLTPFKLDMYITEVAAVSKPAGVTLNPGENYSANPIDWNSLLNYRIYQWTENNPNSRVKIYDSGDTGGTAGTQVVYIFYDQSKNTIQTVNAMGYGIPQFDSARAVTTRNDLPEPLS